MNTSTESLVELSQEILQQLNSNSADICIVERGWELDVYSQVQLAPKVSKRLKVATKKSHSIIEPVMAAISLPIAPLVDDISKLCQLFGELFQTDYLDLRLDITDEQSCPKFHCDNVFVRLLVTYAGPGTEYIDVSQKNRILQATLGTLVFLKGHKHPTYQDQMLHRSPQLPKGTKRFSVTINFDDWLESIVIANHET